MARCVGCTSVVHGNTNCVHLTGSGTAVDPLLATIPLSPDAGNIILCHANGLFAAAPGGSADPFVTVAAADTPAPFKAAATYICTGVNDDVMINNALTASAASGGVKLVFLLQGLYATTGPIDISSAHLIGAGARETLLVSSAGINTFVVTGGQGAILEGLRANSNGAAAFKQTVNITETVLRNNIFDTANGLGADLGQVVISNGSRHIVEENIFANQLLDLTIGRGLHIVASETHVLNNHFLAGSLYIESGFGKVLGNRLVNNNLDAITLGTNFVQGSCDGNIIEMTCGHGILVKCDSSQIINNLITGFDHCNVGGAGTGTKDGIHILAPASKNQVTNNYARNDPGSPFGRYGINVNGAGATKNWVTNNDLLAGNVTAAFNDTGTTTNVTAGNRLA